jgi:predicted phage tail protein
MQTVYLNGSISKFGDVWHTDCDNIRDIFKLIECQTSGFRQHLVDAGDANVGYEIQRGSEFLESENELLLSLKDEDIIITEVPSGSKSGGAKILAAIAIIAVAFIVPGGLNLISTTATSATGAASTTYAITSGVLGTALVGVATNLALTGISQLLAPGPETDQGTAESYLFNGPTNNITQGLPVPVAYGELIVGGAPISFSYVNNSGSYATIDPGSNFDEDDGDNVWQ